MYVPYRKESETAHILTLFSQQLYCCSCTHVYGISNSRCNDDSGFHIGYRPSIGSLRIKFYI